MRKPRIISRRQAIITGVSSLGALMLPGCTKPLPPTYGNILRMGDNLTYIAQRALLPGQSLAREYSYADISSMPGTGVTDPSHQSEEYAMLLNNSFEDWKLEIEGLVARPASYTMKDLQSFSSRTQITKHFCEEGWSAIAEWTGVPLSAVLLHAGMLPTARFVVVQSYDGYVDSIDMMDALHPQTILAYGMNGRTLSITHGAPLRIRVERHVGYKNVKYLKKITVSDKFIDYGEDTGWSWWTGI
jgi:DMSO/TMAO reductase YedYZ molybdopterin-dependent catalytic subunit